MNLNLEMWFRSRQTLYLDYSHESSLELFLFIDNIEFRGT